MEWVLVLIVLETATPVASQGGEYATMVDCFAAREYVMEHARAPHPAQAVCVRGATQQKIAASQALTYRPH